MTDPEPLDRPAVLTVRVAHHIGDLVYHRASEDPASGVVIGYHVWPGSLTYIVNWFDRSESQHFECELTSERPSFDP